MDGIREVTGCEKIEDVMIAAEDRRRWHSNVTNVNLDKALG